MMQFSPAIIRGSSVVEFPRPILSCRIQDSWDYLKLKVPRQDGNQIAGPSRDGVNITIEGEIGSLSGTLKFSESDMLDAAEILREALHASTESGYELGLFKDASGNRRTFLDCFTNRLEIDFSNPSLFSYSVSIHASNPKLHGGE